MSDAGQGHEPPAPNVPAPGPPPGPGWWFASDGRWYPPELAPGQPGHGSAPQPGAGWGWRPEPASVSPGLATALRIVFLVVAGGCGIATLLNVWGLVAFEQYRSTLSNSSHDRWIIPETVLDLFGLLLWPVTLGLLVLVILWSWQAHRAAEGLGWNLRWRIGWTIGAWFIPCASIALPKIVIGNIERLALARRREGKAIAMWHTRPGSPLGWVWWIAFVLYNVRVGFQVETTGDITRDVAANGDAFTTAYVAGIVSSIFGVVSAIAGAAYFASMSERLTPAGLTAHRDD